MLLCAVGLPLPKLANNPPRPACLARSQPALAGWRLT